MSTGEGDSSSEAAEGPTLTRNWLSNKTQEFGFVDENANIKMQSVTHSVFSKTVCGSFCLKTKKVLKG